jgi:hypothetical protein
MTATDWLKKFAGCRSEGYHMPRDTKIQVTHDVSGGLTMWVTIDGDDLRSLLVGVDAAQAERLDKLYKGSLSDKLRGAAMLMQMLEDREVKRLPVETRRTK